MDFAFTEDQFALKEQLSRALGEDITTAESRAVLEGTAQFSQKTWDVLAELGVLGIGFGEDVGGLGLSPLFTCVTLQELGRVNGAVPYGSSLSVVAEAINAMGTDSQKQEWLPDLLSGEKIATWAVAEGTLPDAAETGETRHGAKGVTGTKTPVPDAGIADVFLVLSRNEDGAQDLLLVPAKDPSVTVTPLNSIDPSRPIAEVTFAGATFDRLGDKDVGWQGWTNTLDRAAIYNAYEQIGGAEAMLDIARAFILERKTFGRSVASYQAVKHRMADMFVKIAMARANALYAAKCLEAGNSDLTLAAATARLSALDAFAYCAREGLHLHGGIGVTWEAEPNIYYRRSRFLELQFGKQNWTRNLTLKLADKHKKGQAHVAV